MIKLQKVGFGPAVVVGGEVQVVMTFQIHDQDDMDLAAFLAQAQEEPNEDAEVTICPQA